MDLQTLKQWQSLLETQISELNSQLQALTSECERKRQQLDLVMKLVASADSTHQSAAINGSAQNGTAVESEVSGNGSGASTTPAEVKAYVEQILAEAKRPMKIGEIHAEFIRRGYPIPGKGTPFNILVHISREMKSNNNAKFVWAARGTYALRDMQQRKKRNRKTGQEGQ